MATGQQENIFDADEIDVDFEFIQARKILIGDALEACKIVPGDKLSMLCCSSKYGLLFAGKSAGLLVIQTETISKMIKNYSPNQLNEVVSLNEISKTEASYALMHLGTTPFFISLNSDNSFLSVCCRLPNCSIIVNVYDIRSFSNLSTAKPAYQEMISNDNTKHITLRDFQWNPCMPDSFVVLLSPLGHVTFWKLMSDGRLLKNSTINVNASSICWSPKGKQLAVGIENGVIKQFRESEKGLEEVRTIPNLSNLQKFTNINIPHIKWFSTYLLGVLYSLTETDGSTNQIFLLRTTHKNSPVNVVNFSDIYLEDNEGQTYYYTHAFHEQNMIFTISGLANQVALLMNRGKSDDYNSWISAQFEETSRAELPLNNTEDTFAVGFAIDHTAQAQIQTAKELKPPHPILYMLTTVGILIPFHMVYTSLAPLLLHPQPIVNGSPSVMKGMDLLGSGRNKLTQDVSKNVSSTTVTVVGTDSQVTTNLTTPNILTQPLPPSSVQMESATSSRDPRIRTTPLFSDAFTPNFGMMGSTPLPKSTLIPSPGSNLQTTGISLPQGLQMTPTSVNSQNQLPINTQSPNSTSSFNVNITQSNPVTNSPIIISTSQNSTLNPLTGSQSMYTRPPTSIVVSVGQIGQTTSSQLDTTSPIIHALPKIPITQTSTHTQILSNPNTINTNNSSKVPTTTAGNLVTPTKAFAPNSISVENSSPYSQDCVPLTPLNVKYEQHISDEISTFTDDLEELKSRMRDKFGQFDDLAETEVTDLVGNKREKDNLYKECKKLRFEMKKIVEFHEVTNQSITHLRNEGYSLRDKLDDAYRAKKWIASSKFKTCIAKNSLDPLSEDKKILLQTKYLHICNKLQELEDMAASLEMPKPVNEMDDLKLLNENIETQDRLVNQLNQVFEKVSLDFTQLKNNYRSIPRAVCTDPTEMLTRSLKKERAKEMNKIRDEKLHQLNQHLLQRELVPVITTNFSTFSIPNLANKQTALSTSSVKPTQAASCRIPEDKGKLTSPPKVAYQLFISPNGNIFISPTPEPFPQGSHPLDTSQLSQLTLQNLTLNSIIDNTTEQTHIEKSSSSMPQDPRNESANYLMMNNYSRDSIPKQIIEHFGPDPKNLSVNTRTSSVPSSLVHSSLSPIQKTNPKIHTKAELISTPTTTINTQKQDIIPHEHINRPLFSSSSKSSGIPESIDVTPKKIDTLQLSITNPPKSNPNTQRPPPNVNLFPIPAHSGGDRSAYNSAQLLFNNPEIGVVPLSRPSTQKESETAAVSSSQSSILSFVPKTAAPSSISDTKNKKQGTGLFGDIPTPIFQMSPELIKASPSVSQQETVITSKENITPKPPVLVPSSQASQVKSDPAHQQAQNLQTPPRTEQQQLRTPPRATTQQLPLGDIPLGGIQQTEQSTPSESLLLNKDSHLTELQPHASPILKPQQQPKQQQQQQPLPQPQSQQQQQQQKQQPQHSQTHQQQTQPQPQPQQQQQKQQPQQQQTQQQQLQQQKPQEQPEAPIQTQPQQHPQTHTKTQHQQQPEAPIQTQPQQHPQTQAKTQHQQQPEAPIQTQPQQHPQTQTKTQHQQQPEAPTTTQPQSQPTTQVVTQTQTKLFGTLVHSSTTTSNLSSNKQQQSFMFGGPSFAASSTILQQTTPLAAQSDDMDDYEEMADVEPESQSSHLRQSNQPTFSIGSLNMGNSNVSQLTSSNNPFGGITVTQPIISSNNGNFSKLTTPGYFGYTQNLQSIQGLTLPGASNPSNSKTSNFGMGNQPIFGSNPALLQSDVLANKSIFGGQVSNQLPSFNQLTQFSSDQSNFFTQNSANRVGFSSLAQQNQSQIPQAFGHGIGNNPSFGFGINSGGNPQSSFSQYRN